MSIFYNVCAGNLDTLIINPMILQCAGIFLVLLVFVFNVQTFSFSNYKKTSPQ